MKVQLIGPMTGLPDYNYPAFHEAAKLLTEQGHSVFNPADSGDQTQSRAHYMRASIAALLEADVAVTLPGWESSPGAKTEMRTALAIALPVVPLDVFLNRGIGPCA